MSSLVGTVLSHIEKIISTDIEENIIYDFKGLI